MRTRAAFLLAVLAFAAGPALRLDCLLSCAINEPAGVTSCHARSQPDVSIQAAAGHCVTGAQPAAVTAKRIADRVPAPIVAGAGAAGLRPARALEDAAARTPLAASPHPATHRLPLRI